MRQLRRDQFRVGPFRRGDSPRTARRLLDQAYAADITMFDTANTYGGGRSETWLGEWLTDRRGVPVATLGSAGRWWRRAARSNCG